MSNVIEYSDMSGVEKIGNNNIIINSKFVGEGIVVGNNCTIKDCIIASSTTITDSYLESSFVGKNVSIGPYSHLRPNCNIGDNCKIGNFVELKNSQLGKGVKVSHLSYVGDAVIGDDCNIGCGVVFANYNGKNKNISIVGKKCFIGSNVNVVAPIKIKDETFVCAGTTITDDTENGDFVIGRVRASVNKKYSYYLRNKENG